MSEDAYREVVIGRFFLFILYGSSVRSLSLATLHVLSVKPVTFFILHECSTSIEMPSLGGAQNLALQNLMLMVLLIPEARLSFTKSSRYLKAILKLNWMRRVKRSSRNRRWTSRLLSGNSKVARSSLNIMPRSIQFLIG